MKPNSKQAEDRKFPRRSYCARAEIEDHIHGKVATGSVVDINPMGVLLECRRRFAPGEVVTIRFPSPEGEYDLVVQGEVVRAIPPGPGRRGGVAIELFGIEDWIFDELCNYVYGTRAKRPVLVSVSPPGI